MKIKLVLLAILFGLTVTIMSTLPVKAESGCYCGELECCPLPLKAILKSSNIKAKDKMINELIFQLSMKISMEEITDLIQKAVLNVDDNGSGGERP